MSRIAVHALDFKLISVYASRSVGKSQCLVCSSAPCAHTVDCSSDVHK